MSTCRLRIWFSLYLCCPRFLPIGAFGAHPGHDAHLLTTLSGIQILLIHDALDQVDIPRVVSCASVVIIWYGGYYCLLMLIPDVLSLQNASGSFSGDQFGETDTRFTYCAVQALSLLGKLDALDVEKTIGYLRKCRNFDGGFGSTEGAESHSAQGWSSPRIKTTIQYRVLKCCLIVVFVCVAALAILDRLDEVDQDMLGWWLAERQLPNGGLNGRPEKLEDVSGC